MYQLKNWMKIVKKTPEIVGVFLYYSRSVDPTMLMTLNSLAVVYTNTTIKTAKKNSIFKLQHDIFRRSNRIQKERNDSPYLFRSNLHFRIRGTKQSWWILFSRTKIQHTATINSPQKLSSTCIIQHNE